jgi:outer membrane murein-binding lipoprotein Lpp
MMKKQNVLLVLVLMFSLMLAGCCSNYKTYADSMANDLEALDSTYRGYVENDERLSEADRKARLSVLEEMQDKTRIAQEENN